MSSVDPATIARLIESATNAMDNAYAPYSKFRVGAAVLLSDGGIIQGCNVENASFGATICAERTAITTAIADGRRDIRAICVTNTTDTKITPCGICRQFIYEFDPNIPVFCCDNSGGYREYLISDLLPDAFTLD
ncbi:cytidine deaminase [Amylibacter marinus]|uniref:Cytidine deaminase n=1 Tax=Amylibacter marinus TaxID=1475483 RepID=A0ABQ5VWL9_9RHOB|nr:cytidine deaminase [Amylibacter marinus]GLQ35488.1 cytidine deaminase [Amylibacter marinus]